MSELEGRKIIDVYRNKLHINTIDEIKVNTHGDVKLKSIGEFNIDFK
jgi:hypothetical protein